MKDFLTHDYHGPRFREQLALLKASAFDVDKADLVKERLESAAKGAPSTAKRREAQAVLDECFPS